MNPNPDFGDPEKVFIPPGEITSEDYRTFEEIVADEIDVESMTLYQQGIDNPAFKDTVEYQVRLAELRGKQDLLERTTRSFADRVSEKGVEHMLKQVLGEDPNSNETI